LDLARRAQQASATLLLHPAQLHDIERDEDLDRRRLRRLQSQRYPRLEGAPPISERIVAICGEAATGSNDWVDHQLLAAVQNHAVDFLLTEDRRIHAKARRLGLSERVMGIDDAIAVAGRRATASRCS
jgi:hypothetical protein